MWVCLCVFACVSLVDHSWLQHHSARGYDHPGHGIVGATCGEVQHPSASPALVLQSPLLAVEAQAPAVQHGHHGQPQGGGGERRREQRRLGQTQRRAVERHDGRPHAAPWWRAGAAQRAEVQGSSAQRGQWKGPAQALQTVTPQEGGRRPRDDDVRRADVGKLGIFAHVAAAPALQHRAHPARGAVLLGHKVAVGFDVLAQGAGVRVALQAAYHLAVVGLVHVVRARVLEAVAGVGVALVAALVRTNVRLLTYTRSTERVGLSDVFLFSKTKAMFLEFQNNCD